MFHYHPFVKKEAVTQATSHFLSQDPTLIWRGVNIILRECKWLSSTLPR